MTAVETGTPRPAEGREQAITVFTYLGTADVRGLWSGLGQYGGSGLREDDDYIVLLVRCPYTVEGDMGEGDGR